MAQNEMRAMRGLPVEVRSMEGLGLALRTPHESVNKSELSFMRRLFRATAPRAMKPACDDFSD